MLNAPPRNAALLQAVLASIAAAGLFAAGLVLVFGGQDWLNGPPPLPPESARATELSAAQPIAPAPGKAGSGKAASGKAASAKAASGKAASGRSAPGTGALARGAGALPRLPRAAPVSLDIPAIGVHTPVMKLGLKTDGTIAVPPLRKGAPAGWYRYLASPGEAGPAVILGHVDSARDGPAVFYRLGDLRPGDTFTITRADGWVTTFTIRKIGVYEKTEFPSEAVYGDVPGAEVRLVTCGGPFDESIRHYRDNIVVFAKMTAAQRKAGR